MILTETQMQSTLSPPQYKTFFLALFYISPETKVLLFSYRIKWCNFSQCSEVPVFLWNICTFSHCSSEKMPEDSHSTALHDSEVQETRWGTDLDYGRPGEYYSPKNFPRTYWSQASNMNLECLRDIRQTRVFSLWGVSQFRTPLDYSEIFEAPDLCIAVLTTISNSI